LGTELQAKIRLLDLLYCVDYPLRGQPFEFIALRLPRYVSDFFLFHDTILFLINRDAFYFTTDKRAVSLFSLKDEKNDRLCNDERHDDDERDAGKARDARVTIFTYI
jgi:hypothetical protein